MHAGSVTHRISRLEVGEYLYVETAADEWANVMRRYNMPKKRRPAHMQDWIIECQLYQGVKVSNLEPPKVLVRVERKA